MGRPFAALPYPGPTGGGVRLLQGHDLLFVRGEDSFVRALWAGRPFLWHIYPQDDEAHIAKLDDFLDHYLATLPADAAQWLRDASHALNHGQALGELAASGLVERRRKAGTFVAHPPVHSAVKA